MYFYAAVGNKARHTCSAAGRKDDRALACSIVARRFIPVTPGLNTPGPMPDR